MKSNGSARGSAPGWKQKLVIAGMCAYIAAVLVALCPLSGCATSEKGLARETQLYLVASNGVNQLKQVVPYVPSPANGLLEGVLAVGSGLLAVWATHLHRSLKELRNGNTAGAPTPGPAVPPPNRAPKA